MLRSVGGGGGALCAAGVSFHLVGRSGVVPFFGGFGGCSGRFAPSGAARSRAPAPAASATQSYGGSSGRVGRSVFCRPCRPSSHTHSLLWLFGGFSQCLAHPVRWGPPPKSQRSDATHGDSQRGRQKPQRLPPLSSSPPCCRRAFSLPKKFVSCRVPAAAVVLSGRPFQATVMGVYST